MHFRASIKEEKETFVNTRSRAAVRDRGEPEIELLPVKRRKSKKVEVHKPATPKESNTEEPANTIEDTVLEKIIEAETDPLVEEDILEPNEHPEPETRIFHETTKFLLKIGGQIGGSQYSITSWQASSQRINGKLGKWETLAQNFVYWRMLCIDEVSVILIYYAFVDPKSRSLWTKCTKVYVALILQEGLWLSRLKEWGIIGLLWSWIVLSTPSGINVANSTQLSSINRHSYSLLFLPHTRLWDGLWISLDHCTSQPEVYNISWF